MPTAVRTVPSGSIQRSALVSESATHRRSGVAARPDGCANHASAAGPSTRPSFVVPAAALHGAGPRVVRPQLVDARHGDPHLPLPPRHVPRRRQGHFARVPPGRGALHPLGAGARDRGGVPGGRVPDPQRVVDGVRDHHPAVGQGAQPLRLAEPRLVRGPVGEAALATADPPHDCLTVRPELHQLVPGGVGDQDVPSSPAPAPCRGSAGASPPAPAARTGRRRAAGCPWPRARPPAPRPARPARGRGPRPRAGRRRTLRVDDDERRPGPHGVLLPRGELRVVQHGVLDAVPLDRVDDGLVVGLVHELRRVDADDHHRVPVLLLQLPQLVEDVQAVDAAEGPEIEDQYAAPEVGERQGLASGVQPAALADQLGGADAGTAVGGRGGGRRGGIVHGSSLPSGSGGNLPAVGGDRSVDHPPLHGTETTRERDTRKSAAPPAQDGPHRGPPAGAGRRRGPGVRLGLRGVRRGRAGPGGGRRPGAGAPGGGRRPGVGAGGGRRIRVGARPRAAGAPTAGGAGRSSPCGPSPTWRSTPRPRSRT